MLMIRLEWNTNTSCDIEIVAVSKWLADPNFFDFYLFFQNEWEKNFTATFNYFRIKYAICLLSYSNIEISMTMMSIDFKSIFTSIVNIFDVN